MDLNLLNGLLMIGHGYMYISMRNSFDFLFIPGIIQIIIGTLIIFVCNDIVRHRPWLFLINFASVFFGFGFILGPILAIIELNETVFH